MSTIDSDQIFWRYPSVHGLPPRGVKMSLLTMGNQQVVGDWSDIGYKAWAPLIKRDKDIERTLGYL